MSCGENLKSSANFEAFVAFADFHQLLVPAHEAKHFVSTTVSMVIKLNDKSSTDNFKWNLFIQQQTSADKQINAPQCSCVYLSEN